MRHLEGSFTGSDAMQLFYQCWLPEDEPRAVLAIVHGIGEHGGRYSNLVNHLVPRDIGVYALDLRGHGRSPGKRGALDGWDQFVGDVDAFVQLVRREEPQTPLFLMGHSMGGLIVASYLLDRQAGLQGAVLSSPLLEEANVSAVLKQMVKLLNRVRPGFAFDSGLDPKSISRDPAEVQRYVDDPLVHSQVTVRLGSEMLRMLPLAHARAGQITLPLLVYHGEGDLLVPIGGSQRFHTEVGSPDRVFRSYPGGYHELHNDIDRQRVLTDLHSWLERHID